MNNLQSVSDKTSISLSLLCAAHCLFLPFLLILYPSLASLPMGDEAFHVWMLVAVVPLSMFALYQGYKSHNSKVILSIGFLGIAVLIMTTLLGHDLLSEDLEKMFTLVGALIVAGSHFVNFRKCHCSLNKTCTK